MVTFATEFPVHPTPTRAEFIANVVAWLDGTEYSTVFGSTSIASLDSDNAVLHSDTGEELRFREIGEEGALHALGFRYDRPENQERLWRTECVLSHDKKQCLVRIKTQCIAREPGARLEVPRKPYFVKNILDSGWGGQDGMLDVTDKPLWLKDSSEDLDIANLITCGLGSNCLPIIYISAVTLGRWLLEGRLIESLAYKLGGVAHIVVEPNRNFSYRLRDATSGKNAYGGSIGVILPEKGIVRRFFLGFRFTDSRDLANAIGEMTLNMRSHMPAEGWEWTDVQERALHMQRERDKNKLSDKEENELLMEEIANLQDRNKQLQEQVDSRPLAEETESDDSEFFQGLAEKLGPEIYPGEMFDRLRLAARKALSAADRSGLDDRSRFIFEKFVNSLLPSPALGELRRDLVRASKDPKRAAHDMASVLERHGYQKKSEKRHVRLKPKDGYVGLDSITLPKTPSDGRAFQNARKDAERNMKITEL